MHAETLGKVTIIPSETAPTAVSRPQAWSVGGLHCAACADGLAALLRRQPGVEKADVGYAAGLALVHAPVDVQAQLPEVARRAGYSLVLAQPEAAKALRQREARNLLWRTFVAGFCMMQIMMLAAPTYFASGAEVPPDLRQLLHWGSWVLSWPVVLFAAQPYLVAAWRTLRQRQLGMDVPVSLGVLITFIVSSLALFDPAGPWGPEVYFDSLSMFMAFLLLGRWFELRARHAAATALTDLQVEPDAQVQREQAGGALQPVSIQQLAVGDVLHLSLGERVPADALLLAGSTWADEACTSGESAAVPKRAGDTLLAGSVNLGSPVRVRVLRAADDSHVQQMAQALQQALTQRPADASDAERWAGPFLAGVLLLALLSGLAWAWIEPSRAVAVVCAVLIVTCPCALALAAPAARVASTAAMARRGVMVQRLSAWDALARIDCVALDKTGTLTQPEVHVRALRPEGSAATVVASAAALAAWSHHPLSKAVVRAVPRAVAGWRWADLEDRAGAGLRARDPDGRWWRLGSAAWLSETTPALCDATCPPGAVLFGPEGEAPWLAFDPHDAVSPQAQGLVAQLKALGLQVRLLSGDQDARVQALAAELGVAHATGQCSPVDKQEAVRQWTLAGQRVLMVGDGVNDAPVLAQAHAAVAVGGASALASRAADAVLLRADLTSLPQLLRQAQRTRQITRQNLTWATAYNLLAVPLALLGYLPPWAAGLGMALSSALVVANASRLGR